MKHIYLSRQPVGTSSFTVTRGKGNLGMEQNILISKLLKDRTFAYTEDQVAEMISELIQTDDSNTPARADAEHQYLLKKIMDLVMNDSELFRKFGFSGDCYRGIMKSDDELDSLLTDLIEYHGRAESQQRFLSFSKSLKIAVEFATTSDITFEEIGGVCELVYCRNVKGLDLSKLVECMHTEEYPAVIDVLNYDDSPLYEQEIILDLTNMCDSDTKFIQINNKLWNTNVKEELVRLEVEIRYLDKQDSEEMTGGSVDEEGSPATQEGSDRVLKRPIRMPGSLFKPTEETHLFK